MLSNHTVGNMGRYYGCYRPCPWMDCHADIENANAGDVIAYSDEASSILTSQVKALARPQCCQFGQEPCPFHRVPPDCLPLRPKG